MNEDITFGAGSNLAIKVPPHLYEKTVQFYRDIIGLPQLDRELPAVVFQFGDKKLWIDKVDHLSRSEIWLELTCDSIDAAQDYLKAHDIVRRDEIERLPDGFQGFWIAAPDDIIHLVSLKKKRSS